MAMTIRVMFRYTVGEPWRRLSEEEKQTTGQKWMEILKKWSRDPGIRFVSYYLTPSSGVDPFAHHFLFELDDVRKVLEMNGAVTYGQPGPYEKYSFEVVWGNTDFDGMLKP